MPTMNLSMRLIRSATVTLHWNGFTLLVDPYLADAGAGRSYGGELRSPLVPLPLSLDELLRDVDAVFVSHLHSDHFDDAARETLPKSTWMLCPPDVAGGLRADGFTRVQAIDGQWEHQGLRLRLTGGRHGPDAVLEDLGAVHGFVAQWDGGSLYWVGDSIFCPEVERTLAEARPAAVVVHACGADWMGHGPIVMDCGMVEAVLRAAPAARVIATHMDAVDHATVTRAQLRAHFGALPALAQRLCIPADGERIAL